jgi:hypothetical protein
MLKLKPQSLIEVGCGSGELFSCYKDIPIVLGVDWQDKMLERSQERITRHEYKNIQLLKLDITKRSQISSLRRYDVVLTRTVLMHIQPELIKEACRNMTLLSDTVIAFEYFSAHPPDLASHNWNYDYISIFRDLNYTCKEAYDRPDGVEQILFHFTRDTHAQNNSSNP